MISAEEIFLERAILGKARVSSSKDFYTEDNNIIGSSANRVGDF